MKLAHFKYKNPQNTWLVFFAGVWLTCFVKADKNTVSRRSLETKIIFDDSCARERARLDQKYN